MNRALAIAYEPHLGDLQLLKWI